MKITIRTPQMQDYDRFSAIMDQVQQMHVDWRPDVYKPASPLITKELFGELLKGDSWYIAETDGIVVGVLEVFKRHVEGPAQVTRRKRLPCTEPCASGRVLCSSAVSAVIKTAADVFRYGPLLPARKMLP